MLAALLSGCSSVVYRDLNVCETEIPEVSAITESFSIPLLPVSPSGPLRVFQIAVDADNTYFQRHGSKTEEVVRDTLDSASAIFQRDFGISIEVTTVVVRTSLYYTDPESIADRAAGPGTNVLRAFKEEWNANQRGVIRDAAIRFTLKPNISTGRAHGRTACRLTSAYAYVRGGGVLATAHELAHILGVGHDIVSVDGRYIMGPSIGSDTAPEFSARSKSHIAITTPEMTCLEPVEIPAQDFIRGDVTGDGSVTITDGMDILGGEYGACLDAADVNDDGSVNIADGVYLLLYLFRNGTPPPPPFPGKGPDPTPDFLGCER